MTGGVALIAWAFWWEPGRLVVDARVLELPGWPDEAPLRVGLIADLHVGSPRNGLDNLARVVRRVNEHRPDVILIAGDVTIDNVVGGRFVPPEEIANVLEELEAPHGVFAVLGNHDRWLSAERVTTALTGAGITVLENRAAPVDGDGPDLWIAGVSDFWTGHPDVEAALAGVPEDATVVLFTHNPDIFPEVPARVALTLAGHTHGGQVIIPFVGPGITPSRYGEKYAADHVVENGRHLFVTTGVGTSRLGVRFLVPPEIAILDLRACESC